MFHGKLRKGISIIIVSVISSIATETDPSNLPTRIQTKRANREHRTQMRQSSRISRRQSATRDEMYLRRSYTKCTIVKIVGSLEASGTIGPKYFRVRWARFVVKSPRPYRFSSTFVPTDSDAMEHGRNTQSICLLLLPALSSRCLFDCVPQTYLPVSSTGAQSAAQRRHGT